MPMIVFAWAIKLAQCALKVLNLALVIDLLALGKFQRFQHFFHLFERMFQFLNDAIDLINGLGNCRLLVLWLRRLGLMASLLVFNTFLTFHAFASLGAVCTIRAFGAFDRFRAFTRLTMLGMFSLLRAFIVFRVLLGRMLGKFRRGFARCISVLGFRRCGGIAGCGRGTAVLAITAAAGMASAAAPGSASGTRCCRIRLLG